MDIGSGFATIDYPEQLSGSSIIRDDHRVYVHIKDRRPPTDSQWDWDTPTGLAKINHEVWGGGSQCWQRWVNSPTGPQLVHAVDLNDALMGWWGAPPVAQQSGETLPEVVGALRAYGLLSDPQGGP